MKSLWRFLLCASMATGLGCSTMHSEADMDDEKAIGRSVTVLERKLAEQETRLVAQGKRIDHLLSAIKSMNWKMMALEEKVSVLRARTSPTAAVDPDQLRARVEAILKKREARLPRDARPLPVAVLARIQAMAPGADVRKARAQDKKGRTIHRIDLKLPNGQKGSMDVAADGQVLKMKIGLTLEDLPQPVARAMQAHNPAGQFRKARKILHNGRPVFDVEFKDGNRKLSALLDAQGKVIEREDEVTADALSPAVQAVIGKDYPDAQVRKAKHLLRDGKEFYEVELRNDNRDKIRLRIDPKGQLLEDPRIKTGNRNKKGGQARDRKGGPPAAGAREPKKPAGAEVF